MKLNKPLSLLKKNIVREPWLAASSILVITITLMTLNIFMFSLVSTNIVLKYLESRAQISVFFLDKVSEDQILGIKSKMENDIRISRVDYISKDEALRIFKEMNKDEPALLESVQSNPLPASLEVKAKNINDLKTLSEEFGQLDGVDRVKFFNDVVDSFRKWSNILRVGSFVLMAVMSLVSVLMVLITIGITIHSKGVEVEILKLVGATDKYVKEPLMFQGIFYGLSSAILSTLLMLVFLPFMRRIIGPLFSGIPVDSFFSVLFKPVFVPGSGTVLSLLLLLIIEAALGFTLGYIGSAAAIKKYLKY